MSRSLVACLIAFGACALAAPSAALAGGPSAGDQQYIDPLASSGHHGSSGPHHGSTTPTAPAPAPTSPASTPSIGSGSSATASATTANTNTKGHDPGTGLPMTGFNALLAALIGAVLLVVGALVGRIARRA